MRPLIKAIPHFTNNTLTSMHADIHSLPPMKRREPDWKEVVRELEREMKKRGLPFEEIAW